MRIVEASWSFEHPVDGPAILRTIEQAGRTCYKNEARTTLRRVRYFTKEGS